MMMMHGMVLIPVPPTDLLLASCLCGWVGDEPKRLRYATGDWSYHADLADLTDADDRRGWRSNLPASSALRRAADEGDTP